MCSLLEKKNICIYCMREMCAFFGGGVGVLGKNSVMYFMNLSVPPFVYLLIIYVFIGFYLSLS